MSGYVLTIIVLIGIVFLSSVNYTNPRDMDESINIMVRQAARWSTAAEQDSNAMIAVLHANYGAGYLWALKDIASDDEIEKIANINMRQFTSEIVKVQDNATRRMANLCPKFAPDRTYLTRIGGEH